MAVLNIWRTDPSGRKSFGKRLSQVITRSATDSKECSRAFLAQNPTYCLPSEEINKAPEYPACHVAGAECTPARDTGREECENTMLGSEVCTFNGNSTRKSNSAEMPGSANGPTTPRLDRLRVQLEDFDKRFGHLKNCLQLT
uniref:Uncharacterized protein n=1 Tax=Tetraselmis sp. GSL018 TaxID=582737 RepID=A0A061SFN7_9CHLO|eukprot:CAMPEP_0177584944 /NCGR_PEP_ID=MMETSP0419_2-20121207/4197_1 /TAXON_ID=582737 /ORGANISM="Tetraselmis sp., Strain GSL018" /LENGTH=141 /DNA_ID=CAMNT_0019074579 /DNA_START=345 /DNA_END=770 /DNA_ORIENTATION=-